LSACHDCLCAYWEEEGFESHNIEIALAKRNQTRKIEKKKIKKFPQNKKFQIGLI